MHSVVVALIGNPNCGKTTLFNGLTGRRQRVGNWSGVTVEEKRGQYTEGCVQVEVVDLPGCYSVVSTPETAMDERITHQYLLSNEADLFINVVDATNLERHLYLTLQLLERGVPVIVALNMMDSADKQEITIDVQTLAKQLGCPVVPLVAVKEQGIAALKKIILHHSLLTQHEPSPTLPFLLLKEASEIEKAKARYEYIQTLINATVCRAGFINVTWSERIDSVLLNRILGIPLFLALMYCVFMFSIHVGGIFQDFFDIASRTLFIDGPKQWLSALNAPNWLIGFAAFGIGQGMNTTISFIPIIASMFLCLSFLESSGYMARAAFVMDKVMQWAGLPGKSFVPMIIGFGCNVPAIMATRTLENYRERILTILMSPFMSCGARLAIYALFVSAFFPKGGQNIIFGLYLIGMLVALLTGFALRSTVLKGERSPLVIEFPPYRWPSIKVLTRTTWHRLKRFIVKAGILIVPLCILIGTFGSLQNKDQTGGWLATLGRTMTPLFAPMGIKQENWPATVGLLTGVLAKEVVVGTLSALYLQGTQWSSPPEPVSLKEGFTQAFASVLDNGAHLGETFRHPLLQIPEQTVHLRVLGIMVERFGSAASAFAYLLFVLLYFPCVSVVATIARELNKSWAAFSVIWTTGVAYTVAVVFYQSAIFMDNPLHSSAWILGSGGLFTLGLWGIRKLVQRKTLHASRFRSIPTQILVT